MGSAVRFTRACSTCGRKLDIPVSFLGREVACSHCGSQFVAMIPGTHSNHARGDELDQRVDRLLDDEPKCETPLRNILPMYKRVPETSNYEV